MAAQSHKLATDAASDLAIDASTGSPFGAPAETDPAADAPPDLSSDLSCEFSAGIAADHAALAFGIPRIEPVPLVTARLPRRTLVLKSAALPFSDFPDGESLPPQRTAKPSPKRGSGFALEDQTESLTAAEPAAATIALHAPPALDTVTSASGETAKNLVRPPIPVSEQLTAMLRVPKCREKEGHASWEAEPVKTAAMPSLPSSREATTTTLTLPAVTAQMLAALGRKSSAQRGLLFAGGSVLGAVAVLVLWALPLAGRSSNSHGGAAAVSPAAVAADVSAERLIEQALDAVRAGQSAQAAVLLLHYQHSHPAGAADPTLELMLRVLRKQAAAPLPGR